MPYFVYILYSQKRDRYYIGHTENLAERLLQHNAGRTPSTKPGRPWRIVYQENCEDKSQAYHRELEIKGKKSRTYIEQLIKAQG
jgi:putative endonuclease